MDNLNIILDKEYKTYSLEQKKSSVFYHGGVDKDFNIFNIDIYKKKDEQSNSYTGFYMFGEEDYESAINCAIEQNKTLNTDNKGVLKLELDRNLRIYTVPPFLIKRITENEIKDLKTQGYDLIKGKMLDKYEYILLNKGKIINIEFLSLFNLDNVSKEQLEKIKLLIQKNKTK